MPIVVIAPQILFKVPGKHIEMLNAAGFEVRYPTKMPVATEAETIAELRDAAAVIAGGEPYNERVLGSLPKLRVIARAGVGFDCVDLEAATRRRVVVTITPAGNHEAVAEHTLALLLALAKEIVRQDREVRQGVWSRQILVSLRGKTLGIVGLGRIGRDVAMRAAGFRMKLLAYEPYPDRKFVRNYGVELLDLETLLARSDFVTLHVPLSEETRGVINRRTLSRMKRGSYVINTARGGLIVEEDLLEALRSGRLAGAGLDVFAAEPTPMDNPLLALDNVIASPHMAGCDTQSNEDMAGQTADCIVQLYRGGWPEECVINRGVREGWKW